MDNRPQLKCFLMGSNWVGSRVTASENRNILLTGGDFIADIQLPRMLHASILRSPYAHAKILNIDASRATSNPEVFAVLTGHDLADTKPFFSYVESGMQYRSMAIDRVRFVGEPVAAIAATSAYAAEDALEQIEVEYEPLDVVVDTEKALLPNSVKVHENSNSNVAWHGSFKYGEVAQAFKNADLTITEKFQFHRYTSAPIETAGVIADYNAATGSMTIYDDQQDPGLFCGTISDALGIPTNKLRFVERDIGGGFGCKIMLYPYCTLIGLLSKRTNRPVKWIETRQEHLTALMHSSERVFNVEFAANKDGTILAIRGNLIDDLGAYPRVPDPGGIIRSFMTFTGCYRIKNIDIEAQAVVTNKCPTGPNRGYGCQHAYFSLERMMDLTAKKLGIDPAEIRFRNFITKTEFPYQTAFGCLYETGDYQHTLQLALETVGYEEFRKQQKLDRSRGRRIGIGIAAVVEPAVTNLARNFLLNPKVSVSGGTEAAMVRVDVRGLAIVALGSISQGGGHRTVAAQIVADELGIRPEDVNVVTGFDSFMHPWSFQSGTWASRFSAMSVGAIVMACRRLRDKILLIGAHLLGVNRDQVQLGGGCVFVKSDLGMKVTLRQVAERAYRDTLRLPRGVEPGLFEVAFYEYPQFNLPDENRRMNMSATYGNSVHIITVEVDQETGVIRILRYIAVHDCGKLLNPIIVEGQIHGGAIQGLSGALYERLFYDENGQLLTATFMDYLLPTSREAPDIEVVHTETPSPYTALGAKGMGEGPAIPGPAALANAVEDALSDLPIKITNSAITPESIWRAIKSARTVSA